MTLRHVKDMLEESHLPSGSGIPGNLPRGRGLQLQTISGLTAEIVAPETNMEKKKMLG